jgi:CrcB protein
VPVNSHAARRGALGWHPMSEELGNGRPDDADVLARPSRRSRPRRWDIALAIAAGGAVGGTMRHAVSALVPDGRGGFPWGTFAENVSGALLLAVLVVYLIEVWPPSRYVRPFLATGLLGGYTTFSTVMNETRELMVAGRGGIAVAYVAATLLAGLTATVVGLRLGRRATRVAR